MVASSQTKNPCAQTAGLDVLLISMPFGPLFQPSIGLSSLKGVLQSQQVAVQIRYLTIKFAERIGVSAYHAISNGNPYVDLAGEWLFAAYLFEDEAHPRHDAYIDDVLRRQSALNNRRAVVSEDYIETLLAAKSAVPAFIEKMAQEIAQDAPPIIGFTSTFQQHVPSLCLAKALKAQKPDIFIVMGGANCEGMMGVETVRQFPFIDAVVSGEGEITFPQVVQHALNGLSVDTLQGVYTAQNADFVDVNGLPLGAIPVRDMDQLPIPDYQDYFDQVDTSMLLIANRVRVLLETSRGCWWGERHHCTFCGLNGESMTYRSKSPERALNELVEIYHRYPTNALWVVDNILDMKYFDSFMPELAKHQLDLDMFYEVKANLRKEQLALLAEAGIHNLQPGIESLSDHVLQLMKKGVSWLQNVQLLKWSKELGIAIYWNILWGFPEESVDDYQQMEAIVPLLHHLDPPVGSAQIRLDRFSPNFNEAAAFGFVNVRPAIPYHYIYPFDDRVLSNLAYHFFYDYKDQEHDVRSYTDPLFEKIKIWRKQTDSSALFYVDLGSHLLIWDFREIAQQPLTILFGAKRMLYLACDKIQNLRQLEKELGEAGFALSPENIRSLVKELAAQHLLLNDNNRVLALAPALGETYHPSLSVLIKMQRVLPDLDNIIVDYHNDPVLANDKNLTAAYFDMSIEQEPVIYAKALLTLIGQTFTQNLMQPSYETIAGITIDT